ncbi:protein of unknown function [Pararobbsia alpina]|uniref:hypothetical protein n=1 Tax=Pararobbsia alpina TaxID=621374 RepID=UPI0039A579DB
MRIIDINSKLNIGALFASVLLITGCATKQPAPQVSHEEQSRSHVDGTDAFVADPDHAKIVMTTSGMPMFVRFLTSTSDQACTAFQPVGTVFDSGRGVILPGIAHLTEKVNKAVLRAKPSRTIIAEPGVPIQVEGIYGDDTDPGSNSCGPLVSSLTPEKGHVYHVNFHFNGKQSCAQSTTDVTDLDHPVHVGTWLECGSKR